MHAGARDKRPRPGDKLPASDRNRPARKAPVLDEVDREIVRLLQLDGRMSNTEIGRRLSLTETTIRKRIASLLEDDLIEIVAVPRGEIVGLITSAIFGLSVDLPHLESIRDRIASYSEVRYVGVSVGRYDMMVEGFFADHEHMQRFLTAELGRLEGVKDVETSLILEVAKFGHEWSIPASVRES